MSNINNLLPLSSFPISMLRLNDTQLVINDLEMGGVKVYKHPDSLKMDDKRLIYFHMS